MREKMGRPVRPSRRARERQLKFTQRVVNTLQGPAVRAPEPKRARGASGKKRKPGTRRKLVLWEVFSGTGTFGATFREEFGWDVYQIDSSRDLARKTGAVCADVRNFDFSSWPHPDLIFSPRRVPVGAMQQKIGSRKSRHGEHEKFGALVSLIG